MKISDTVVGAGFVTAGACIFTVTLGYPTLEGGHPGPALFPRLLAALMVAFGGFLSLQGLRARDASDAVAWRSLHRNPAFLNALVVLGSVVAYVLFVERVGFLLMGGAVLFAIMWRLEVRPLKALLVAVLLSVSVHFLFAKVLRVPLSLGVLWW